jgi:hypothetical protein
VSRRARKRAAAAAAVALAIGIALAVAAIQGTWSTFSAETENASSAVAGGWVVGPSGFNTPVASGNGEYFTWTPGSAGVTAQEVYFADQGTTANCTGASYTNSLYSGGTALGAAVASIDGANSGTSSDVPAANRGDYICYQIRSTHNAWFTSTNVGTAVQVGLVPSNPVWSGAGSGQLTNGQTITIQYNQAVAYSGGSIAVTATNANTLTLPGIGVFNGGTITNGVGQSCSNSTVAPPSGGGTSLTLTITLGGCPTPSGSRIKITAGSGPPRYTGSGANVTATIGPAGHAYSVNQCTNSTGNVCTPQMTY